MRVVVAEDTALLREGLRRLLVEAAIDVVAEAASYDELVRVLPGAEPDVVLTDIKMPPTRTDEGLRAALWIRERYPQMGVLLLSNYVEPEYAHRLLADDPSGRGYLLKDRVSNARELVEALGRVAAGGTVIDSDVVATLMSRRRTHDPLDRLTAREREILRLMAEGLSNAGISRAVYLSPKTIERHVASIFSKLGLYAGVDDNRRVLAVLRHLRS